MISERVSSDPGSQLTLPVAASYRIKLPDGYALFEHHKPQSGGGERVDVYLRVSGFVLAQYRSTY